MSEVMRDEFEKRATADGKFMRAVEKNADGGYRLIGTAADWENWQDAWQASRAAVVVDLPGFIDCASNEGYMDGWNAALDECQDAIHAAGVRTK